MPLRGRGEEWVRNVVGAEARFAAALGCGPQRANGKRQKPLALALHSV